MENRILVGVSTYRKNEALRETLDQIIDGKAGPLAGLHIADAADGHAEEVFSEYSNKSLPFSLHYTTDKDSPIWNTKNMSIEYFLEKTSCQFLILADDDNIFLKYPLVEFGKATINEALLEAHYATGIHHLLCYSDGYQDPLTGQEFFDKFPIIASTPWTRSCGGAQGHYMFYSRLAVKSAGYFNKFPGRYGGEHSEYSARLNALAGQCPEFFTYLENCHRYLRDGTIPNNYQVTDKEIDKNMEFYYKQLKRIYSGVDLRLTQRPKK